MKDQGSRTTSRKVFTEKYYRFHSLLRTSREAAGLTQVALAALLDRPQSFVSKSESGERRLDLVELHEFCQVLGLSLVEFVTCFEAALADSDEPLS